MIGISAIDEPIGAFFTRCHNLVIVRKPEEREGCSGNSRRFSFPQIRLFIEIADLPPGTMYVT
jgi:hypothetical protein